MTHRSLTIILIAALTISLFSACRHGQVGQGAKSSDDLTMMCLSLS